MAQFRSTQEGQYKHMIDIFISASSVVAVIYQIVVLIGWFLLLFATSSVNMCPYDSSILYFVHSLGSVSFMCIICLAIMAIMGGTVPTKTQTPNLVDEDNEHRDIPHQYEPLIRRRTRSQRVSVIGMPPLPSELINTRIVAQPERSQADNLDGTLNQLVAVRRRLQTITSNEEQQVNQPFLETTPEAKLFDVTLLHCTYLLFLFLHVSTLLFGTVTVLPMFFELELHRGSILDETICFPDLFWFAFFMVLLGYSLMGIFVSWYLSSVPRHVRSKSMQELYRIQQDDYH